MAAAVAVTCSAPVVAGSRVSSGSREWGPPGRQRRQVSAFLRAMACWLTRRSCRRRAYQVNAVSSMPGSGCATSVPPGSLTTTSGDHFFDTTRTIMPTGRPTDRSGPRRWLFSGCVLQAPAASICSPPGRTPSIGLGRGDRPANFTLDNTELFSLHCTTNSGFSHLYDGEIWIGDLAGTAPIWLDPVPSSPDVPCCTREHLRQNSPRGGLAADGLGQRDHGSGWPCPVWRRPDEALQGSAVLPAVRRLVPSAIRCGLPCR